MGGGRHCDLVGEKFGRWTVLSRAPDHITKSGLRVKMWTCRCECGTVKNVRQSELLSGGSKSCGCYKSDRMREFAKSQSYDLVGKRFGRLTVLRQVEDYVSPGGAHFHMWLCQCNCGNQIKVITHDLMSGHTQSCGCLGKEKRRKSATKHGLSKTPLYAKYNSILDRCYNPNNKEYKNYGGRGIKMCDEWRDDFTKFYAWAIETHWEPNLTIERIDVNGNYSPDNCTWLTIQQQQSNKTTRHELTARGETHSIKEWADILDMSQDVIERRLNQLGWSDEEALFTPLNIGTRRKKKSGLSKGIKTESEG